MQTLYALALGAVALALLAALAEAVMAVSRRPSWGPTSAWPQALAERASLAVAYDLPAAAADAPPATAHERLANELLAQAGKARADAAPAKAPANRAAAEAPAA